MNVHRRALLIVGIVVVAATRAPAEDVVRFENPQQPGVVVRLSGEVLEFTGRQLEMKTAAGAKRVVPAEQVVDVETTHTHQQRAADELREKGEFAAALAAYPAALSAESRTWVRRQILADMVRAAIGAEQLTTAGDYFLILVQSDPDTRDFGLIPLVWLPGELGLGVEKKSQEWLARQTQPVAQLLGASHLLLTPQGDAADAQLLRLSTHADARIAALAESQRWRRRLATVTVTELDDWLAKVERFPEAVRAGAYFTLAKGLAARHRPAEAARAWMRVPLLHREQRPLAAEALARTIDVLRGQGDLDAVRRLRRELLADFAETRAAREVASQPEPKPPTP